VTPALPHAADERDHAISSIIAIGALVQVAPPITESADRPTTWIIALAVASIALVAINMFGGFAVTRRMLQMFAGDGRDPFPPSPTSAATILFILSLGGLSNPGDVAPREPLRDDRHDDRRVATVLGPHVTQAGLPWIAGAMLVGAAIGCTPRAS